MNNADRQILDAIQKDRYSVEVSVPKLAEIVASIDQTLEAVREQQALMSDKLHKLADAIRSLADEMQPERLPEDGKDWLKPAAEPTILTGVSGHEYVLGDSIGTLCGPDSGPCDVLDATKFHDMDGNVTGCTCIVCERCGKHTGNSNQGHYWGFCSATQTSGRFHFCCPGNCELEAPAGTSATEDQAVAQ